MANNAFRIRIPNVKEGHPGYSVGRTLSTNLVYTIWTVFGGFILHFLLCNYLEVLLNQRYEEPVDGAADILKKGITPIMLPNSKIYRQIFSNSNLTVYRNLSEKLYFCKSRTEYMELVRRWKNWKTGSYAAMRDKSLDRGETRWYYYSSEPVIGRYNFPGSILNKKWPLKKVI